MLRSLLIANPIRHPELVSASIRPNTLEFDPARWTLKQVQGDENSEAVFVLASIVPHRPKSKSGRKIDPLRVFALDQIDFPLPVPALELFFPQDGVLHGTEHFEPDEMMNGITAGKSRNTGGPVLVQPRSKVRCNANIERSIRFAGKNIHARLPIHHRPERACKWMLKQVQHDGFGDIRA